MSFIETRNDLNEYGTPIESWVCTVCGQTGQNAMANSGRIYCGHVYLIHEWDGRTDGVHATPIRDEEGNDLVEIVYHDGTRHLVDQSYWETLSPQQVG